VGFTPEFKLSTAQCSVFVHSDVRLTLSPSSVLIFVRIDRNELVATCDQYPFYPLNYFFLRMLILSELWPTPID
jgi:hypothetical protein